MLRTAKSTKKLLGQRWTFFVQQTTGRPIMFSRPWIRSGMSNGSSYDTFLDRKILLHKINGFFLIQCGPLIWLSFLKDNSPITKIIQWERVWGMTCTCWGSFKWWGSNQYSCWPIPKMVLGPSAGTMPRFRSWPRPAQSWWRIRPIDPRAGPYLTRIHHPCGAMSTSPYLLLKYWARENFQFL